MILSDLHICLFTFSSCTFLRLSFILHLLCMHRRWRKVIISSLSTFFHFFPLTISRSADIIYCSMHRNFTFRKHNFYVLYALALCFFLCCTSWKYSISIFRNKILFFSSYILKFKSPNREHLREKELSDAVVRKLKHNKA